jgi:arylsulfatase A-like enzyme
MDYLAYANQDGDLLDATMNLFKQNAFNDPFFLYVHYDGVHGVPYPSGPYLGSILPIAEGLLDRSGQSIVFGEYKPNQQFIADKQRLRYDEAIRYQDVRLKDLIDTIKEADLYDSSMIIITADHGQVFDNGFTTHCTPLVSYAETHVPLLIKYPFQEHGEMIHSLVSTIDITPTIMDILGIPYKPNWFDGISLLEIDESQQTKRSVYTRTSTESNLYLVVTQDQYKITLRADEFFLFDYKNDPSEKENLIPILGDDHEIVQNLMQALEQYLAKIEQYQK